MEMSEHVGLRRSATWDCVYAAHQIRCHSVSGSSSFVSWLTEEDCG